MSNEEMNGNFAKPMLGAAFFEKKFKIQAFLLLAFLFFLSAGFIFWVARK
ncbi:MAG: hypothetical protein KDE33_29265 [Bacteroidetes bacterium]|nr:hypothetical protein [Bacteroidota bacterium]